MRNALLPLLVLSNCAVYGQQAADNEGNSYLAGNYFFRWVIYSGVDAKGIRQGTAAYGRITFDGRGSYQINGQTADSLAAPVAAKPLVSSGRYTVSAGGMAEIENPIFPGDTLYAGVGASAVVGSSTEHGNHDLFVAIPAPTSAATNSNLTGSYKAATFDFLRGSAAGARDGLFSLEADGKGSFGPFQGVGSSADGLIAGGSQNVTGATYSLSADGSGTAAFPSGSVNPDARLVAGSKVLFVSADGEIFIAGSPAGFDLIVGIRALTGEAAQAAYRGLYYTASVQQDNRSGSYHQSLHGARNIQGPTAWYQERINAAPDTPENHYDGSDTVPTVPFDSDGVYANVNFYRIVGAGGRVFFEVGRGRFFELYLGAQARPLTGSGVFLNPYGVVSGANLQPPTNPIAPGEIISIFGSGFATSRTDASSLPLPATLGNVEVKINGRPAPLLSVGPEQINLVVPYATTERYAHVQVFVSGQPSNRVVSYTRSTAPGVFTIPPGGAGDAAVLHTDYSVVSRENGARPGETVMAFVTGLGAVVPAVSDGAPAPASPLRVVPATAKVSVYVGGLPANVNFVGLAPGFAGLYQINFEIPGNIAALLPGSGSRIASLPVEVATADGATIASMVVNLTAHRSASVARAVPTNTAPVAYSLSVSTNENTPAAIALTATDVETPLGAATYGSHNSAPHGTGSATGSDSMASAVLNYAITSKPAHGALSGDLPNLIYTPAPNYVGPDSFQFTATDRGNPENCVTGTASCALPLTSAPATVAISVLPVNSAPSAIPQSVYAPANGSLPITLSGTDAETPAGSLVFNVTVPPAHGVLSGSAPNLTYTPASGYTGPDSLQFTVTDCGHSDSCGAASAASAAPLTSAAATVSINVRAANTAPTAISQSSTGLFGNSLLLTLTGNDAETPTSALTYTVVTQPQHGALSIAGANVTYVADDRFYGDDSFRFTVTDRGNPDNCGAPGPACAPPETSSPGTISITIPKPPPPVNTAPQANPQTVSANQNTPKPILLTGSDTETPAAGLTFAITSSPAHGSLSGNPPNVTYTPAADYFGADSFQFKVTDRGSPDGCSDDVFCAGARESAPGAVSISVQATNAIPSANAQSVTTSENTALPIILAGSDAETAAGYLTYAVSAPPAHGSLTGTAPNLTYTPNSGYFGPDSFEFTVTDRGNPDNCGAAGGSCAARATSAPATVNISVAPVNTAPTATAQSVTANENTGKAIKLAGTDAETAPSNLSFAVSVNPAHGTLSGTAPNLTYTSNANYIGPDSFQFTVTDRGKPDNCGSAGSSCAAVLTSTEATVSITVVAVNTPPTANSQSLGTNEGVAIPVALTANDAETASANLAFTVTAPPVHGALSGVAPNLVYTPAAGYYGVDSFSFRVRDLGNPDNCSPAGSSCAAALDSIPAAITLTISPVNIPPSATAKTVTVNENVALPITLAGADTETAAANLTFTISVNPVHGALSGTAPNLTYTPNANYIGPDSFQFTVTDRGKPDNCGAPNVGCSGAVTSSAATVTISVAAVNSTPTATGQSVATNEGTPLGITLNASDPETAAANLTYTITQAPAHGILSGSGPNPTYTPNAGYFGPDSFQFTVTDRGNPDNCGAPNPPTCLAPETSTAATVTITVLAANTPPTVSGQSLATNEDNALSMTLSGGDTETAPANLTYTISQAPAHGTLSGGAGPNRTYTPDANYSGPDSFQFTVTDRGKPDNCSPVSATCAAAATSAAATVSMAVAAVNDAPSFTINTPAASLEDAGAQSAPNVVSSLTPGPADESGQTVALNIVSNSNPGLFSAGPAISATGALTYTAAANTFGTATITVAAQDNGGTANGGVDTSAPQTFVITVNGVNDAPSFTLSPADTSNEDAGPRVAANFAGAISAGPNEAGQVVTFQVTGNSNPGLFSSGPAISSAGTLTYTAAANGSGSATITVVAKDNGGTSNGGVDTSAPQSFTITINPVNDPPSFAASAPPAIFEDAGPQTVPNTVTGLSAGPAEEASQTVTLSITGNTNPALFTAGPAIDSSGTLTYTPAANAFGSATITIQAQDSGGTANGGSDTTTHTVAIIINSVNDAPSFTTTGNPAASNEDAGAQTVAGFVTTISPGSNEAGQNITFVVTGNSNPSLFSAAPAISAAGALTYTAAANQNGSATITYHAHDDGGTANGGVDNSAYQSFTITVNPVNDPPTVTNKAFTAQANMPIDIPANVGLLSGVSDAADNGVNGCISTTFSLSPGGITGTNPAGGSVVANADGSFRFTPPPGVTGNVTFSYQARDTGCPGTGADSAAATVTFAVAGPVIWFVDPAQVSNGNGTLLSPFNVLSSAGTAAGTNTSHRIFVKSGTASGNVTLTGAGTQATAQWLIGQGVTGADFDAVMGITPPAGTIARPAINGVNPTIAGTLTLGAGNTSNNIVRGVAIQPSPGNRGLVAATSGTGLTVGAASFPAAASDVSVSTINAAAVDLSSGGSGNFIFKSVSASGGPNGIAITNFNASAGGFTVTGDGNTNVGGNGSGGTIQNTTGDGISLTNTQGVSFTNMKIQGSTLGSLTGSGIRGAQVSNFAFKNGTINNIGHYPDDTNTYNNESNIRFDTQSSGTERNLSGTVTITDNVLNNATWHGIDILNFDGTISQMVISGNSLTSGITTGGSGTSKGNAISIQAIGSATTVANITKASIINNVIRNFPGGAGIQALGGNSSVTGPGGMLGAPGSATDIISITGNLVAGASSANRMGTSAIIFATSGGNAASRSQSNFDVSNNGTVATPLANMTGIAIGVGNNGNATMTATINNNVISAYNSFGASGISGGNGIVTSSADTPDLTLTASGNTISQTDGNGILLVGRGGTGIARLKIQDNVVSAPLTGVRPGIRIDAGNAGSVDDAVCLNISGNTSAGSGGTLGLGLRKQGTTSTINDFGIVGLPAGDTASPQVESYVNSQNASGNGTLLISAASGFSSCPAF